MPCKYHRNTGTSCLQIQNYLYWRFPKKYSIYERMSIGIYIHFLWWTTCFPAPPWFDPRCPPGSFCTPQPFRTPLGTSASLFYKRNFFWRETVVFASIYRYDVCSVGGWDVVEGKLVLGEEREALFCHLHVFCKQIYSNFSTLSFPPQKSLDHVPSILLTPQTQGMCGRNCLISLYLAIANCIKVHYWNKKLHIL